MKKKIISLLLAVVMIVGMLPLGAITAFAAEGVKYLEYNTSTGAFDERTCTDYTTLAGGATTWEGGWYVAPAGKLELGKVSVNSSSYLILTDGCELIIGGGIDINNNSTLTIYAQSEGENAGNITATGDTFAAGIGNGWLSGSFGNIIINGGNITAVGGKQASGIGSGFYGSFGNITINGGTIVAKGGDPVDYDSAGAAIGCGTEGSCGDIIINGGDVTAIGADSLGGYKFHGGNGIGNSYHGTCGKVIINGGNIAAAGGRASTEDSVCGKPFNAEVVLGEQVCVFNRFNGEMLVSDNIGTKNYCDSFNALAENDYRKRPVSAISVVKNATFDNVIKYYERYEELDIALTKYKIIDSATMITSETRSLTSGWYKADGAVKIDGTLAVTGDIHIILNDGCTLRVTGGIKVESGNSLSIYPEYDGSGQLVASGYDRVPGIGGFDGDAGDITIHGGNITATGGLYAAGIGGGEYRNGGNVTICGGSVTANGGSVGAGIGGGEYGHGGTVNIYGGSVTANGGYASAGIGGGNLGNGGTVTIYGGSVTAKGGSNGAGIGSGNGTDGMNGGNVYIYGGNINAVGGFHAAGIGGGNGTNGASVYIGGGSIIATGGEGCAAFGSGYDDSPYISLYMGEISSCDNAVIYNGRDDSVINGEWYKIPTSSSGYYSYIGPVNNTAVKDEQGRNTVWLYAKSDTTQQTPYLAYNTNTNKFEKKSIDEGKAFGVGGYTTWDLPWYEVDGNIKIDGTVTVKGDVNLILKNGCKLEVNGGIKVIGENSLTIYAQSDGENMGSLIATGVYGAAGIGGGYNENGGTVTINGGKITANGGFGAAGIGGGYNENGGTVTINGGKVTATGGEDAAGIGCGCIVREYGDDDFGDGGIITVNGGNITATGKGKGAGIGGGFNANGNTFTMTGGVVSATGVHGAGIGGGYYGYGSDFTFSGGSVTAYSEYGAGIGIGEDGGSGVHNGEFNVAEGTVIKASDIPTSYLSSVTAQIYAQYRYKYVSVHLHDYTGEYKNNGNGTHSRQCVYCDVFGASEEHTFVNHICVCGATSKHSFTGDYVDNGDGTHSRKCTGCDEHEDVKEAHTVTFVSDNNATCTEDGTKSGTCEICGAVHTVTDAGTKKGHDFTGDYVDNGDGTHSRKCTRCDEHEDVKEAHTVTFVSDNNATCTEDGTKSGTCEICGIIYTVPDIGTKKGHDFTGDYVNNGDGTHSRKCSRCDELSTPEVHSFTNGVCACGEKESKYILRSWDGDNKKVVSRSVNIPSNTVKISNDTVELNGGWYVLRENVEIENRIVVKGTAQNPTNIILFDGFKLDAKVGIEVAEGNVLNIFTQNDDTGEIVANTVNYADAAIGGENGGTITVNGGTITVTSKGGAGIGGGAGDRGAGNGGTFTINGGTVIATTSRGGAGIGGGRNGGTITINGGTVKAYAIGEGNGAAGIGGGYYGNGGTITINGGTVEAISSDAMGIGGGLGNGGGVLSVADGLLIMAGDNADNAVVVTAEDYKTNRNHYVSITALAPTPKADDFNFIPPANCVCDGQAKYASVTTDKEGMGNITVKYQKKNGDGWDSATTNAPTELGKYRVVISVEEGANYLASAGDITSDSWVFEIICQHNYINYVCEHCGDELLEDAKSDAIKAINDAEDHSEDIIVNLLAETARTAVNNAQSVAEVLYVWDYWLTAINKQLGGTTHEHTYSENWSYNELVHWHNATCEHSGLTSDFAAHTFGEGVENGNITTYTCTECGYIKYVYNTAGDNEGEIVSGVSYTGISLTLGSDIAINFYMNLTEEARNKGTMTFDIGGRIVTGIKVRRNENGYYFSTPLTALEMAETVKATFSYNGVDYIQEYSVLEYIEAIVGGGDKYTAEMKTLAKKIANYGYYAQIYLESIHSNVDIVDSGDGYDRMEHFGGSFEINVEEAKKALADHKTSVSGSSENLSLYGTTVYFDSATALNYYVTAKNGEKPTAAAVNTATGKSKEIEIKLYKKNIYIVSVKDITATELADNIEVTVNGEITFSGSVFAYCNSVVQAHSFDGATEKDAFAVNAMAAFYEYYKAACEYAKTQG